MVEEISRRGSTLHCFIHCSPVRKNRKNTFLKEWKSSLYFNWQSPASPTARRCCRRRCSRAFVPSLVASASGYCFRTTFIPNLYIQSTLNTDLIFWQLFGGVEIRSKLNWNIGLNSRLLYLRFQVLLDTTNVPETSPFSFCPKNCAEYLLSSVYTTWDV